MRAIGWKGRMLSCGGTTSPRTHGTSPGRRHSDRQVASCSSPIIQADRQLLRPLYPGQLHTIKQNLWNVVLVLDLSQGIAIETVANALSTMIQRGVPIRFGLVPMFDPEVNDVGKFSICILLQDLELMSSTSDGQAGHVLHRYLWPRGHTRSTQPGALPSCHAADSMPDHAR